MPKRKNRERQQARKEKQRRRESPPPPDLSHAASTSHPLPPPSSSWRTTRESDDETPPSSREASLSPLPPLTPTMSLTPAQLLQALVDTNANLQTLTAQVGTLAAVATNPHAPSSSKKTAAPPDDYDGDIKKCKAFLQSFFLYFHGESFTDNKKITMTMSYLKGGNAEEWRN